MLFVLFVLCVFVATAFEHNDCRVWVGGRWVWTAVLGRPCLLLMCLGWIRSVSKRLSLHMAARWMDTAAYRVSPPIRALYAGIRLGGMRSFVWLRCAEILQGRSTGVEHVCMFSPISCPQTTERRTWRFCLLTAPAGRTILDVQAHTNACGHFGLPNASSL